MIYIYRQKPVQAFVDIKSKKYNIPMLFITSINGYCVESFFENIKSLFNIGY